MGIVSSGIVGGDDVMIIKSGYLGVMRDVVCILFKQAVESHMLPFRAKLNIVI
jgi:hypothetical protein